MTYVKPELVLLGAASDVIQGAKPLIGDNGPASPAPAAFELED